MQKINYCDLHCDTLTKCLDAGESFFNGNLHASLQNLNAAGCNAQCFAIFTEGANAKKDFFRYLNSYFNEIKKNERHLAPVKNYSEYVLAKNNKKIAAILTVENLGFVGDDLSLLKKLSEYGVCMASLVWNNKNKLASPNLVIEGGTPNFNKRCAEGLSSWGRQAVEILDKNQIIIDISHLSDGGVKDILNGRKTPVVASHSNAFSVCGVSRNLQDEQIKKIAEIGGVIGVNFCKAFLGEGENLELLFKHINHIIAVGGEDAVAFGSDFDGIPATKGLETAKKMPNLLKYISERMPARVLEKLCYKNFERVFREVTS